MCDVVLLVGQRELYAHKAVLAAVSPTLFDLLSPSQHQQTREESPPLFTTGAAQASLTNGHHQQGGVRQAGTTVNDKNKNGEQLTPQQHHNVSAAEAASPLYLEFGDVDFDCFDALINYAYSGRYVMICGLIQRLLMGVGGSPERL